MRKVLIIGGHSGIGLASAKLFEANRYAVVSVSRLDHFDFTQEEVVENFFKHHTDFSNIVITATTSLVLGKFQEVKIQKAREGFEKYWGMVNVIHHAKRHLKVLEAITLVSGAAATKRGAPISHLSVVCGAINNLAENLAVELAPVRINVVAPGVTDTPLYAGMEVNLKDFVQGDPLKRVATAEEVAEAIYFVSTHPQITGAIIPCDGGSHLV